MGLVHGDLKGVRLLSPSITVPPDTVEQANILMNNDFRAVLADCEQFLI